SGVQQTRTSDDVEGQGNAMLFLAEAEATAGRDDDAARSAREARALFEAKGNVVSAARAAALFSPADGDRPQVRGQKRKTPAV
ncbi:MAG TPA: hypothetical protein VFN41_00850, partial [Candidatus Limnocylindrales bacterium]|nr:hypothetical protein [Candidatus Limnocylindrales bacterium]